MTLSSNTIMKSRVPNRYIAQSGIACWVGGGGDGGDSWEGDCAGPFGAEGDDSVVKALTALQAL